METTKKGRPTYQPDEKTRAQIQTMSGMGIPDYDIAKIVQLSAPTIRKYYMDALENGHVIANTKVAQSLFEQATKKDKPNISAAIFWLKCRAGWREDSSVDEMGKKEAREVLSRVAEKGTDWEGLLQ